MDNNETSRSRSRSRDRRSNHESEEGHVETDRRTSRDNRNESSTKSGPIDGGNNLYITNLSFQTTEESLRAFFRVLGEVSNASVVREPQTQSSRGFGFVSFADANDSERAVQELNGKELDSRIIRVEKARRANGYEKTPGRYLGPPQVSAKFGTAGNVPRDVPRNVNDRMGDSSRMGGGDRMGGSGDRYPPLNDRGGGGYQTSKDDRGYGGRGGYDRPAPIYREERGREREREGLRELSREIPRYETRGRSPPPHYYDDRGGGGGAIGGSFDDRRGAPIGSRGRRDDYPPQSQSYSRPRDEVRRVSSSGQDRGVSYGSSSGYSGSYDSRPPPSSGGGGGGGYDLRGSYDSRGGGGGGMPPRQRY